MYLTIPVFIGIVPLSLLNKTLLACICLNTYNSGIYRLALRQPVICLPMLSIKPDNSACFFIANIFISTHNRISNFNNSKSSKNVSRQTSLFFALLAHGIILARKNWNFFLLNNLIFFLVITVLTGTMALTTNFYIFRRIFEFSYIGFIPFVCISVFHLYKYRHLGLIVALSLILLLIGEL